MEAASCQILQVTEERITAQRTPCSRAFPDVHGLFRLNSKDCSPVMDLVEERRSDSKGIGVFQAK